MKLVPLEQIDASPQEPPGAHVPPGAPATARQTTIAPTPYAWRDPASIPTRQWLYGRHYIRRFISATIAPPGVGKSSLGLVEDIAMASGRPLLGSAVAEPLRVWSWNGEDPREEIERRVAAIVLRYEVRPEEVGDRLFLDSGREQEMIVARVERGGVSMASPVVEAIRDALKSNRIDVLRIDPFVSCHRVSENDNGAIDAVAKAWARIADETNCAIELVHHARKTSADEVTVDDARGASALLGAVRSARVLNAMTKDEAAQAGVEKRREYFRLDNGKSSMAPPPDSSEWFRLVSQPLGNGSDGLGDFVGVVMPWQWPNALDGLGVADLRKVQDRIAAGEWGKSVQSASWAGLAVADALGLNCENPTEMARIKSLLRTWLANSALKVERLRSSRDGRDRPMIVVGERA